MTILYILFLLIIVIWGTGYLWETHLNNTKPGRVLYHGSNLKEQGPALSEIIQKYCGRHTSEYALVELGSGMGTVARYLCRAFKWREVVAVEIGPFIIMLGRLRFLFAPLPVQTIQQDIFKYSAPEKSVLYCYLFPAMLDKLYKENKLKGQLVISLTFQIPDCVATETYKLGSWQTALFVYDFR